MDREVHTEIRAEPERLVTHDHHQHLSQRARSRTLLSVFDTNEIRKNRYPFEFDGRKFSIDMFLGDLFGLVLAEISFETDEDLDNFAKPPFALIDVTNDPLFSGGRLCELTFADVRAEIAKRRLLIV